MNCSVCLNNLNEELTACANCFAIFHKKCSDRASQQNDKCPLCKTKTTFKHIPTNSFISYAANLTFELNGIDILSIIQTIKSYGIDATIEEIVKMSFLFTEFNDLLETIDIETKTLKDAQKIHKPEIIDAHYKMRHNRLRKQEEDHMKIVADFDKLVMETVNQTIETRQSELKEWETQLSQREEVLRAKELEIMATKTKHDNSVARAEKCAMAVQANASRAAKSKILKRNQKIEDVRELLAQSKKLIEKLKKENEELVDQLDHANRLYSEIVTTRRVQINNFAERVTHVTRV